MDPSRPSPSSLRLPVCGPVQSDLPIRLDWTEPYRGPGSSGLVQSLVADIQHSRYSGRYTVADKQQQIHSGRYTAADTQQRIPVLDKQQRIAASEKQQRIYNTADTVADTPWPIYIQ